MLRIVTIKTTSEIDQFFITLYMCRHKDRIRKMAYLTFAGSEEKNSGFKFIGTNTNPNTSVGLISSNTSLISNNTNLISASDEGCLDTCSFYDGPSDSAILAFGESSETCGSIAYADSTESCGSIAYAGSTESCGSVASVSSGSSFSGGGCSYSC